MLLVHVISSLPRCRQNDDPYSMEYPCEQVYGPEIIGGFSVEEKTEAVSSLGRTNYGFLRNMQPLLVDPLPVDYPWNTL